MSQALLPSLQALCRSVEYTQGVHAFLCSHVQVLEEDEEGELAVIQAHAAFVEYVEGLVQVSVLDAAGATWDELELALGDEQQLDEVRGEIVAALAPADDLAAFREALVTTSLALEADLLERWREAAAAEAPAADGTPAGRSKTAANAPGGSRASRKGTGAAPLIKDRFTPKGARSTPSYAVSPASARCRTSGARGSSRNEPTKRSDAPSPSSSQRGRALGPRAVDSPARGLRGGRKLPALSRLAGHAPAAVEAADETVAVGAASAFGMDALAVAAAEAEATEATEASEARGAGEPSGGALAEAADGDAGGEGAGRAEVGRAEGRRRQSRRRSSDDRRSNGERRSSGGGPRWRLGPQIGSGAFARVFVAYDPLSRRQVAIKQISVHADEQRGAEAEREVWRDVQVCRAACPPLPCSHANLGI